MFNYEKILANPCENLYLIHSTTFRIPAETHKLQKKITSNSKSRPPLKNKLPYEQYEHVQ